jgi:hypothetical protein
MNARFEPVRVQIFNYLMLFIVTLTITQSTNPWMEERV